MQVLNNVCFHSLVRLLGGCLRTVSQGQHADSDQASAELFASLFLRHIDIEPAAMNFSAGVRDHILAGVTASLADLKAGSDREKMRVSSDHMPMGPLPGSGEARIMVGGRAVGSIQASLLCRG